MSRGQTKRPKSPSAGHGIFTGDFRTEHENANGRLARRRSASESECPLSFKLANITRQTPPCAARDPRFVTGPFLDFLTRKLRRAANGSGFLLFQRLMSLDCDTAQPRPSFMHGRRNRHNAPRSGQFGVLLRMDTDYLYFRFTSSLGIPHGSGTLAPHRFALYLHHMLRETCRCRRKSKPQSMPHLKG